MPEIVVSWLTTPVVIVAGAHLLLLQEVTVSVVVFVFELVIGR